MRTRFVAAAGAVALAMGNLAAHKPISDACDWLFEQIGRAAYDRAALLAIGGLSIAGAGVAGWRTARQGTLAPRAPALLALALLTVAAAGWTLVSDIELIHFPQYALLAGLLMAAGAPAGIAWLGATAAGVGDEAYQHLVIYADRADTYFDYNDIVLNALGAAWAVLLLAPPAPAAAPARAWRALLAVPLFLATLILDPPVLTPFLRPAATGRLYHVLSASEGCAAALLVWWLVWKVQGSRFQVQGSTE